MLVKLPAVRVGVWLYPQLLAILVTKKLDHWPITMLVGYCRPHHLHLPLRIGGPLGGGAAVAFAAGGGPFGSGVGMEILEQGFWLLVPCRWLCWLNLPRLRWLQLYGGAAGGLMNRLPLTSWLLLAVVDPSSTAIFLLPDSSYGTGISCWDASVYVVVVVVLAAVGFGVASGLAVVVVALLAGVDVVASGLAVAGAVDVVAVAAMTLLGGVAEGAGSGGCGGQLG